MQRRKYLAALGSLAAGGAAMTGTGAFGAVQADRTAEVEVAGDASAYLQITENGSSPVVDTASNGEIVFDFGADNGRGGSAMNVDGHTEFTNIVEVKNTGKDPVLFVVDIEDLRNLSMFSDVNVFAHDDQGSPEYDSNPGNPGINYPPTIDGGTGPIPDLDPGESILLSFHFNINDTTGSGNAPVYFIAVEKGGQYDNT
jgi:hypothetical protein